mgnify:CR=1 FL=1
MRTNGKGYLLTSKRMVDYMALYRSSDEDLQNPYYAPIISKDLSHQPKTLIIQQSLTRCGMREKLTEESFPKPATSSKIHRIHDALHGFMSLNPSFKHVKKAYRYINNFLKNESDTSAR